MSENGHGADDADSGALDDVIGRLSETARRRGQQQQQAASGHRPPPLRPPKPARQQTTAAGSLPPDLDDAAEAEDGAVTAGPIPRVRVHVREADGASYGFEDDGRLYEARPLQTRDPEPAYYPIHRRLWVTTKPEPDGTPGTTYIGAVVGLFGRRAYGVWLEMRGVQMETHPPTAREGEAVWVTLDYPVLIPWDQIAIMYDVPR